LIGGRWPLALTLVVAVSIFVAYFNVETVDKFPSIEPPHFEGDKKHFINHIQSK
jgi:hypothetical protein